MSNREPHIVLLGTRYLLLPGAVTDLQCTAASGRVGRCLLKVEPAETTGWVTIPDTNDEMKAYDLGAAGTELRDRWHMQRCVRHHHMHLPESCPIEWKHVAIQAGEVIHG